MNAAELSETSRDLGAVRVRALAVEALSVGALAVGAIAVGALALGAVAFARIFSAPCVVQNSVRIR